MPMKRDYLHLDVFADRPFHGNQLAVFLDGDGLDSELMQRIANEMAFSETTFVFPTPAPSTAALIRIFTPARELSMAGHPTIGTVFALALDGRIPAGTPAITVKLGVGPTPIDLEWDGQQLRFAWMRQLVPRFGRVFERLDELASTLNIDELDITNTRLPVQEVSSGEPLLFVPLATRRAVNRVALDRTRMQKFFDAHQHAEMPVFVFSVEPGDDDATVFSRMFAPLLGIAEDPATGGASGPLGAYLLRHGAVSPEQATHMMSLQGVAMNRPSRIFISVASEEGAISSVRVGGTSVAVGRGVLETSSW